MYRYISRESCSQFDSLPLTSLTIPPVALVTQTIATLRAVFCAVIPRSVFTFNFARKSPPPMSAKGSDEAMHAFMESRVADLAALRAKLVAARDSCAVVVSGPEAIKSFVLNFVERLSYAETLTKRRSDIDSAQSIAERLYGNATRAVSAVTGLATKAGGVAQQRAIETRTAFAEVRSSFLLLVILHFFVCSFILHFLHRVRGGERVRSDPRPPQAKRAGARRGRHAAASAQVGAQLAHR